MKPIDQTIFGSPGGNCLTACIASILEVTLDQVTVIGTDETWVYALGDWLRPRGLYPLCFQLDTAWRPPGLYILGGKSPRGNFLHAVVALGDDVIHDPHPSRAGVLSRADATLFVSLDPRLAQVLG